MSNNASLYRGIAVALLLGLLVGYFVYPTPSSEKEELTIQNAPTYSTQLKFDDIEHKISTIQWRVNGTFFMALASLCLGVWNYFQSLHRKVN